MEEKEKTKKDPLMGYIEELKKIKPKKEEIDSVVQTFTGKLETLKVVTLGAFSKFDEYNKRILLHWREYGQMYDIHPELQLIPIFQDSLKDYMTITTEEKKILVEFIKTLIKKSDEISEITAEIEDG